MAYAARQHLWSEGVYRLMTCLLTIPFAHLETDGNVLFSKILHHKHICGNLCKISHFLHSSMYIFVESDKNDKEAIKIFFAYFHRQSRNWACMGESSEL